jgi:hypothetical protein
VGRGNAVTISPHLLPSFETVPGAEWADDIVDLTDRRRVLVRTVLGVDVPGPAVHEIFDGWSHAAQASSTTMRSGGRSSSTDYR